MQDQYSRTQMLLGAEAMTKLHNSRVAVFGVGRRQGLSDQPEPPDHRHPQDRGQI